MTPVRKLRERGRGDTPVDLLKHDLTITYGGRTFAVRAYRDENGADGPGWHTIIVENRYPLRHGQGLQTNSADCFAGAMRFVTGIVEAEAVAASAAITTSNSTAVEDERAHSTT